MAVLKFWPKFLTLQILLVVLSVKCSKLNVPRVLLPIFNDFSVKFTLEATEGGCYKWTTTRNDIIQIKPLDEDIDLHCSTKVDVSAITKEAARNIAVVLAEDVNTKITLRCDVIVDAIDSLSISTTTRELFMEEAPEHFEVSAYDDQGNVFSTLEGVELEWNIIPLGPNKDEVLRYIPFRDSPYETPSAIAALENQGKKGYSLLFEGVKSGSAKVSVRLPFPEYKHVAANEVQLMVVANLLITPPDVYVLPGDIVPFKIYYLNGGRMDEINLPDDQFYLEAEDKEIASSNKKTGNVTALKEGKTRIVLRDRNVVKDDPTLKLPAANINVVQPDYMTLAVLPHKNWAVLVGDHHDIVAEIYSSTNHKLYLGGSVQIFMNIGPEFHVSKSSINGSWATGYGVKSDVVPITARLESTYCEKMGKTIFKKEISAKGDLLIYPRITIEPSEVILPWDPTTRPKYDIDLIAKGGDGRYLWSSSDHSIGLVSQTGHVRTHSNGYFEVSAVMQRNHYNRQSAKFIILPPSRLEIVEFVMEAEVGSPVYLHVALYAEHEKDGAVVQMPFSRCQDLPFHIRQSDTKFKHDKSMSMAPMGISCGNIAMTGLEIGTSKVTVSYYVDGRALEDSATVSAFDPLTLLQPKHDIVLAVGSSVNLIFVGGPRPLIGRASDHRRTVVSEDETLASATDVTQSSSVPREDYSVIRILCRRLGETDVKLMISNMPSASNCKSQTASITSRVICGKPRRITLQPKLKIAEPDACPMDLSSGSVVVQSSHTIELEVAMFDDCGLRFLNFSSLNLLWEVKPMGSAVFLSKDSVFPWNITIGDVDVAHRSYQQLQPNLVIGNLVVMVNVTSYHSNVLTANGIKNEWPLFMTKEDKYSPVITTSLTLFLVEDIVVNPSSVIIFNHPGNKKVTSVKQGSGYFQLALNTEDVANVKYLESRKEIEVTPLKSGELMVQVYDLCLVSKPATMVVSVVSVAIVRIQVTDKVEIGKCIPCIVRLYDENDNLMTIPDPAMIDIRHEFENRIANLQMKEKDPYAPWGIGEIHYIITGIELGDTKLVFTIAGSEEDVNSAPANLQVFQPLRIYPRNGTMLIGSVLQLLIKGGPHPDTNIMFKPSVAKIADISERGIVTGSSLGTTKVFAQSVGIHPSTGQSVVYSEDTIEITVVELQGIKLMGPLTRFRVGAVVPFWVWGLPDIPPLVLGSLEEPPILFKWGIEDKLLMDISGVFQPVGVLTMKEDRITASIQALQPGKTRLYVNATVPGATANLKHVPTVMFSSQLEVEIVPELVLLNPAGLMGGTLLMAPFSQVQLETNFDGSTGRITYSLPGDGSPSTEVLAEVSDGDMIVTVSRTGLLRSYGNLGHALLIITATDEMGLKQRLSYAVEVKHIHYMNLNLVADWRIHSNNPLHTIPLGTEFQLRASFHDNVGNVFQAGPRELKIRTSRCDLVEVLADSQEPATVWIHTKKPGSTLIKAWADGVQKTTVYTKLKVMQSVQPILDHLTSGDIICLFTPIVSKFNLPGKWSSSDSTLLAVNPAIDIGFVGNREGTVTLTHSLLPAAPLHIQIYPVTLIEFLDDPNLILTNGPLSVVERIVLVLQSEKSFGMKTNNLIQGWRCRTDVRKLIRPSGFKCFIKFSNQSAPILIEQLFNVTNSWVPETGQYACTIINLGLNGSDVSTLQTNVTLWATTEDEETQSPVLNIKFLPSVFVPSEIVITDNNNNQELLVVGLPEVLKQIQVSPADSSILYVSEGKFVDDHTSSYKIKLIDYHWRLADLEDAMGIIVESPITRQKFRVIVKVSGNFDKQLCGMGKSPLFNFLHTYKYAIAMTITMLLVFFLTFYFYSNYMQPVVNVNVRPDLQRSPLVSCTPVGMYRGSPAASFRASPPNPSPPLRCTAVCSSPNRTQCRCKACRKEPVYGEASNFYTSPDIRRNRRDM